LGDFLFSPGRLSRSEAVVTRNAKDFARTGVAIVDPWASL
jgi:hypothetical protein